MKKLFFPKLRPSDRKFRIRMVIRTLFMNLKIRRVKEVEILLLLLLLLRNVTKN